jgi:hypothetical protein
MASPKRFGMLDCLTWGDPAKIVGARGDLQDVQKLLALRDALRANEPVPFDAASWMADAIDQTIQAGGSLDQRLGLKRRGKRSIRRIAESTQRDMLLRSLAAGISESQVNKLAAVLISILLGREPPPDAAAAETLAKLLTFKNLPRSVRQVTRILSK